MTRRQWFWTRLRPGLPAALLLLLLGAAAGVVPDAIPPVEKPEDLGSLPLRPELVESSSLIRANLAREARNVSGAGLCVAVLDTGLRTTHIDFAGKVLTQVNFTTDYSSDPANAADGQGHGTNVAGIVCANGGASGHTGIAPGANVIPLKVLTNTGSGSFTWAKLALQWVIANAATYHITCVNMSLGAATNTTTNPGGPVDDELQTLRDMRIAVTISAGNDFYPDGSVQGMAYPGIVPTCISVGAVYDATMGGFSYASGAIAYSTGPDRICPFSQRLHESVNAVHRTDIFAPGAALTSAGNSGDTASSTMHGTSQAAPVTAGVVLLLQEYYLRLYGELPTIDQVEAWLRGTAVTIHDGDDEDDNVTNTNLDFPRVDVPNLLSAVTPPAPAVNQRYLPAGLHNLGVPTATTNTAPAALLGGARYEVARYDGMSGRFIRWAGALADTPFFSFVRGSSLWLWLTRDATLTTAPATVPTAAFDVPLVPGWNNPSNPYGIDLPWNLGSLHVLRGLTDVGRLSEPAAQALVSPFAWVFDPVRQRYQLVAGQAMAGAATAVPWMAGFWVFANEPGLTLRLALPSGARGASPVRSARDWQVDLLASTGDDTAAVHLGVAAAATRAVELAEPPSPLATGGLRLEVVRGDRRLAGSLEPAAGPAWQWELAARTSVAAPVTLHWPGLLRDLPRGAVLELTDLATGATTCLNTRAAYAFAAAAGEERRFRLIARFGQVARADIAGFSVQPRRGAGTAITLTLTAPAEVDLSVRGLGGRLVYTRHDRLPASTTALVWDGHDADGRPVPAGSYQLEAVATAANGAVSRAVRTVTLR